jgi:hypothetical protein
MVDLPVTWRTQKDRGQRLLTEGSRLIHHARCPHHWRPSDGAPSFLLAGTWVRTLTPAPIYDCDSSFRILFAGGWTWLASQDAAPDNLRAFESPERADGTRPLDSCPLD